MRRGTRLGHGHVTVTADGRGINEEIVDALEDTADDFDRAGQRGGERLSEGFRSRMRARLPRIAREFAQRVGASGGLAGERMGDEASESFSERMASRAREVSDRVGKELGDRMASRPEQVRRGVDRAFSDEFADRIAIRFADRINETLGDRLELMMASHQQYMIDNQPVSGNRGGGADRGRRGRGSIGSGLIDAALIGRLFGAGSRNNALNLIGRTTGNIIKLMSTLGTVSTRVFTTFAKGAAQAGEGASMLARMGGGAGAVMSKLGVSLAALGPAIAASAGAAALSASMLAGVMGSLLALVTALASTIASALTGALIVAGGAFGALVAAAGLATVAFMSMTDAQKKMLSEAFAPLRAMMVGIGQIMLREMVPAFSTWSANLQRALAPLAGYAQRFGQAFAQAGNTITASFSGPGWSALIASLGTYLPSIINRMANAFGQFGNGVAAVLAAIMPAVDRFAGYLERVATRFSEWANSAKGRNAIVDFVDRAINSLISLWNATREFFGMIFDLLFNPSVMAAGNTVFDAIADAFRRVRDLIAKAAANGDLQRWLQDGIEFGAAFWSVLKGLGRMFEALYNSGVIDAISGALRILGATFDALSVPVKWLVDLVGHVLPMALAVAVAPIAAIASGLILAGEAAEWAWNKINGRDASIDWDRVKSPLNIVRDLAQSPLERYNQRVSDNASRSTLTVPRFSAPTPQNFSIRDLIGSGTSALSRTNIDPQTGASALTPVDNYVSPYKKWAESLISEGPTIRQQLRRALRSVNKEVNKALREAASAENVAGARSALNTQMESMRASARQSVDTARSALNTSAQNLANAANPAETRKYLREVRQSQRNLLKAQNDQRRINQAAKLLGAQRQVSNARVNQLMYGVNVRGATLADFAKARERMADRLEKANQQLTEAVAMRNDYRAAVSDSIRAFGSLLTAEAKTVDGVEQALTATDITTNLQDRLTRIREFQANLRTLLSLGLSNDAYKQLVDAGVEEGSAYAQALIEGGAGAVRSVNDLTEQINRTADSLGSTASNRLYQSGVDAARGLVDGLNSLSGELDRAAARLGDSIAKQVKRSLGIKSPSRVMIESMHRVGDGLVEGLDAQQARVAVAANRLSARVAVSPEVAAHAARQGSSAVSGNRDPRFRDLIVQTPTENPEAVAMEVLNEVTGRL